ncbi:MAG TPA: HAMP domain-containing sensor histidine kinase [Gemmatimonadales bacterium]|nr:HAMP domain-containing sensor histidine kinase [Gemmatimonadales bacterium]
MALPFRRRIFVILVAMTAIPTGLAVIGLVLSVRAAGPMAGARASLEGVAASARAMLKTVDTTRLSPRERRAMDQHLDRISSSLTLAQRAETLRDYSTAGFAAVIIVLGVMVLFVAVRVAGHLSRQLSRPIDELVGWTRLIRRRAPLPAGPPPRGAPEFEALRQAVRELAAALETARERELESERLRAFREVARRVAHEIKNPLTSMRIAVDQLERSLQDPKSAANGRTATAVEVMGAETDRLERLAREFADFGRLPEGPPSDVDLVELLQELGQTAVPPGVTVAVAASGPRRNLSAHYEPLRRAFANLYRNASEAMNGAGRIDVTVRSAPAGPLEVSLADHGPGVPAELKPRLFEPYFTTKTDGTGLGLALVRQTVEAHGGSVSLADTPGGGATFTITLPT